MGKYLLSCDWGSTVFRLRLIELPGQQVIDEVSSDDGITRTFTAWKANAADKGITRKQYFFDQLKKQKAILAGKVAIKLDDMPIIISGMASSSIGMQELPYTTLPFGVDGSEAGIQVFDADSNFPNPLVLISGVKSDDEVMRGEETQLIGLSALLNLQQQETILILPGTHSKHLHINKGKLLAIKTFMTGELFSLLTHQSILKDSVDGSGDSELSTEEITAFKLGLKKAAGADILNSLFSVRTNQLFGKLNKKQNFYYLSGLLIGTEINYLREQKAVPLILSCGGNLYELYKLALQELELLERTTVISADAISKATIAGQVIIYQNIKQTINNE
jgi:2-dehydro-3-deoxygalactonokinase